MGTDDFTRGAIDLMPAQHQWRRLAALTTDISKSDNLTLHQQSVRIAEAAIVRISLLIEAAAKQNG